MNDRTSRSRENQSRAVGNQPQRIKRRSEATFYFVDNRPEAAAQKKLQEMADSSPQSEKAAQLQAMINDSPYMRAVSLQTEGMLGRAPEQQAERRQMTAQASPVQRQPAAGTSVVQYVKIGDGKGREGY